MLEKFEGYAEAILKGFHFGPQDAFIVISTSGIRPVIVEMALGAKSAECRSSECVSKQHCEQSVPAHSSGKKLIGCGRRDSGQPMSAGRLRCRDGRLGMADRADLDRDGRDDHQHAAVRYGGENARPRSQACAAARAISSSATPARKSNLNASTKPIGPA